MQSFEFSGQTGQFPTAVSELKQMDTPKRQNTGGLPRTAFAIMPYFSKFEMKLKQEDGTDRVIPYTAIAAVKDGKNGNKEVCFISTGSFTRSGLLENPTVANKIPSQVDRVDICPQVGFEGLQMKPTEIIGVFGKNKIERSEIEQNLFFPNFEDGSPTYPENLLPKKEHQTEVTDDAAFYSEARNVFDAWLSENKINAKQVIAEIEKVAYGA